MKRMSFLLLIIFALVTPPAINAYAVDPILACETSTSGPGSEVTKGEVLTSKATMLGNAISVTSSRWEPNDKSLTGALTFYFVYTRKVGALSWKCTNSINSLMTVGIENSANDYEVAVVAYRGGWWSNVVNLKVNAGVNNKRQVCIREDRFISGLSEFGHPLRSDYQVNAYSKISNRFTLILASSKEDFLAEPNGYMDKIIFEYSIDNWKTKAMVRMDTGDSVVFFKALSTTKAHKVRAYPDISSFSGYVQNWVADPKHPKLGEWVNTDQKIQYTVEGCKSNEAIFYPKEVKKSSSICDTLDSNCVVTLVPGENTDVGASTEEITIKCAKGKLVKNVTGIKPKCPTGYKKSN